MLIVVVDPLSDIGRQFMERHVLLHLLVLKTHERCYYGRRSRHSELVASDATYVLIFFSPKYSDYEFNRSVSGLQTRL